LLKKENKDMLYAPSTLYFIRYERYANAFNPFFIALQGRKTMLRLFRGNNRFRKYFALGCFLPLIGLASSIKYNDFTLDNGLHVSIGQMAGLKQQTISFCVAVGAADEHWGGTGITAVLEALLSDVALHQKQSLLKRSRVEQTEDHICHTMTIRPDQLDALMQEALLRLKPMSFTQDQVDHALERVVQAERTDYEDHPGRDLFGRYRSIALYPTPYQHPIWGWPEDRERITFAQLEHWHNRWYMPNNVSITAIGPLSANRVLQRVRYYFSALAKQPSFRGFVIPGKLHNQGFATLSANQKAGAPPVVTVGFKAPKWLNNSNPQSVYSLVVLDALLHRIPHPMTLDWVKGSVAVTGDYNPWLRHEGLFWLRVTGSKGQKTEALLNEIHAMVGQLDRLISDKSLALAKQILHHDALMRASDPSLAIHGMRQAASLGMSHDRMVQLEQGEQLLTLPVLQTMIRRYLDWSRVTVLVMGASHA
jgi:predicted Zn-dependent peptidase